jgi:hypothetical protein
MISKGDLISGTYALMRISGLTVEPSPKNNEIALQVADDYAGELKGSGLDLKWQQPAEYGRSDPSDTSGLTVEMAGPFKKLLFIQLCANFGKDVPQSVAITAMQGMKALENISISVPDASNPPTLPFGSGNEFDYRDRKFYSEPANNEDALYVKKGEVLNYTEDFSQWLVDADLVAVEFDIAEPGVTVGSTTISDRTATAELTFNQIGGYTLCMTATRTGSSDKKTQSKNFIVNDCQQTGLKFGAQ